MPRPLFVIAAYVPSHRNCAYLARTVYTIYGFHQNAHVLVVDNDSPPGNVNASLNLFVEAGFGARLHVSPTQRPSRGQLGSWIVAHSMLPGLPRDIDRVLVLQHSTRLLVVAPARPPNCSATSLSGHRASDFEINRQRDFRPDGPNAIFSAIADKALHVRCQLPCLNVSTGLPYGDGRPWTMVPHATVEFSRAAFVRLGNVLRTGPGAREVARLYHLLDDKHIALKEVNGQMERFGGLALAWLNDFDRTCERPGNRTRSFVAKKHGKTFGGSWRAADAIRKIIPEVCVARHAPKNGSLYPKGAEVEI